MFHNLIIHSAILIARISLAQLPHILVHLSLIDLETRNSPPNAQLHRTHDLRAPCGEIIMTFPGRRLLGRFGGPAVLPFEVVGIGAGGGVGAVLAVAGIAKRDDE